MGAPPNPIDGQQYAELLQGVPVVLEYDGATGGFKQVIDIETGVAINISGTVEVTAGQITVVLGGQFGEDTQHVSGVTGTFILGVRNDAQGSMVNADGDYGAFQLDYLGRLRSLIDGQSVAITGSYAIADDTANPTVSRVAAFQMAYDRADDDWDRVPAAELRADYGAGANETAPVTQALVNGINGNNLRRIHGVADFDEDSWSTDFALVTAAGVRGYSDVTGDWDRIRGDKERGLYTTMISGSFPGQSQAVEIDDAIAGALRAPVVGGANLMYDAVGGNWERDPARIPTDGSGNVVMPQRSVYLHSYQYNAANWDRLTGGDLSADAIGGGAGGSELDASLNTRAALLIHRGNDTFDRAIGTKETGLNVNMISGSWPTSGGAPLSDAYANPTVPNMGAFGMIYDIAGGDWDRDPARIPGDAMAGGVFPQRVAFNMMYNYSTSVYSRIRGHNPTADGVSMSADTQLGPALSTATLLYGVNQGGTLADRMRGNKEAGLNVTMISGSFPGQSQAIEINDAIAGALRAPIAGAANLMYDVVGGNWERDPARLYADGIAAAVLPQRAAFNMFWDYDLANSQKWHGGSPDGDGESGAEGAGGLQRAGNVRSVLYGYRGASNLFDRLIGPKETGLNVSMVSGSWPAGSDNIPADAMSAPLKSMSVTAHLMGYNGVTYDRIYMGQSGSLAVDLVSQLDPVNDEVTAYITGSTSLDLQGKTIVRAVVNISGSAAGEETLVAAVAAEKIKVIETMLIGNADVSVFFQSGFTGTALTGPLSLPSDGDGFFIGTPAQMDAHHFETAAGEALVLDIDANVLIGGWINYYTEA